MFSFCFCFLSKKKVLKKFLICSYFLKKIPLIFRKWNFLIFWERHIQNHGIFRTRGILRTLPNIYDKTFFQKKIYLKPKLYKFFFIFFLKPVLKKFFITVCLGVSISPLIFTFVFRLFLLLVVFGNFTNFRVFRHCFFRCFHFTADF